MLLVPIFCACPMLVLSNLLNGVCGSPYFFPHSIMVFLAKKKLDLILSTTFTNSEHDRITSTDINCVQYTACVSIGVRILERR
ncbi:hypothetical protein O6H91_10G063300 [Diphasiastrum complanatum]|uniref:Uncharacterized protein n=1 Tax=Diphasiastrum complanatum TaxID=34168 RepID=A0ACC2CHS5_DIPCM|nr:hypothetical protein O6H91_10G063300 [Diphasiastrum complanatum]